MSISKAYRVKIIISLCVAAVALSNQLFSRTDAYSARSRRAAETAADAAQLQSQREPQQASSARQQSPSAPAGDSSALTAPKQLAAGAGEGLTSAQEARIEHFKRQFLSKLNLSEVPQFAGPPSAKELEAVERLKRQMYFSSDSRIKRQVRGIPRGPAEECKGGIPDELCCVEKFRVEFKQIGWDTFVMFPDGYFMNLCKGFCDLSNARTHHTQMVALLGLKPRICCAPKKLLPLNVILRRNGTDIPQSIMMEDMIVDSCDCNG